MVIIVNEMLKGKSEHFNIFCVNLEHADKFRQLLHTLDAACWSQKNQKIYFICGKFCFINLQTMKAYDW